MEVPVKGEDERESSIMWHMGRSGSQKNTHFSGFARIQPPFDRLSGASIPIYYHCGAALVKN